MKKLVKFFILFIFLATIPFVVFAGGKDDDKTSSEEETSEWLASCSYGTDEEGMSVFISFNRHKMESSVTKNFYKLNITKDELLEYYDNYKECPKELYAHEQKDITGAYKTPTLDLNSNDSYKTLNYRTKNINPDADEPWISEDDKYASQCYYQLFTGGDENDTNNYSSDLVNINFNINGFNIFVVDKNLNKKSGFSLSMNVGGTKTFDFDIDEEKLKEYYSNSNTGCPAYLKWGWDDKIYLPTDSHSAKWTLKFSKKSSSNNQTENLDGTPITPAPNLPTYDGCESLLGDPGTPGSPAYYLMKAFHVIKYVAIVLLIVLSVMDFIGAIAKQDKDSMTKILKKMMMRFILCIIIILLPTLVELLLKYLVERQTDLCNIK